MTSDESINRRPAYDADAVTESGLSRRGLLRAGAGLGVAGVAAGLMVGTGAGVAGAASARTAQTPGADAAPNLDEPMVAHIHDARTGEVDLFVGEKHVRFTDPALTARLARAAG